ncbi:MAG TPA: hypothetical protein VK454_02055 [Myxococcaceae bacterium]|nr:hypothetical protein [Myxococcaceae bacterium]
MRVRASYYSAGRDAALLVDGALTGLTTGTFDISPRTSTAVSSTRAPIRNWFVDERREKHLAAPG